MKPAFGMVEGVAIDPDNETQAVATIRCTAEEGRAWARLVGVRVKAAGDFELPKPKEKR